MLPSKDFFDNLLAPDLGRIAASNMLGGLHMGLYDKDFLWPVLVWWEALVGFLGCKDDEIVRALEKLPELALGYHPLGFSPPRTTRLPDLHITCRRKRISGWKQPVVSVREAQTLVICGHSDDLKKLSAIGIEFTAKPGTRAYRRSLEKSWEGRPHELRLAPGPNTSLTRPGPRNLAILWFTPNAPLQARLKKVSHEEKADTARDVLGLVHFNDKKNLAMAAFPARIAEQRADRGRPTFIDARVSRRFKCRKPDETARPCWGRAVNLEKFRNVRKSGISGYLERICGRVPANPMTTASDELVLRIRFLGAPQVPHNDFEGVDDKEYADILEQETVAAASGVTLRNQLLTLRR